MATLIPREPKKVCNEIYAACQIPMMIVDANDISVEVLGKSDVLDAIPDEKLAARIQDNPAGQDNELTPFIVIRDITGKEPEPFVPKKPKEA